MRACFLRPVRESDIPRLGALLYGAGESLTSLPVDSSHLANKVHASLRAFYPRVNAPGAEQYLFVLVDAESDRLCGVSGIIARVGGFEPFYTYRIASEESAYPALGIRTRMDVLHLSKSHKGPSEICSLYLDPEFRRTGVGRLLSLARFLFIGAFPERFEADVIAEMRGYLTPGNRSPFWESVAQPFFQQEFAVADFLSGLGDKEFIEALMPRYPIYAALLPEGARRAIGAVHPNTRPAVHLLKQEGFADTDEIDIFDAGPLLRAPVAQVRSIRAARVARVGAIDSDLEGDADYLVGNECLDFRAMLSPLDLNLKDPGTVRIGRETAEILQVQVEDKIRYVPSRG